MEQINPSPVQTGKPEHPESCRARLTRVTPLFKFFTMVLFVVLPFLGAWLGFMQGYELAHLDTDDVSIPQDLREMHPAQPRDMVPEGTVFHLTHGSDLPKVEDLQGFVIKKYPLPGEEKTFITIYAGNLAIGHYEFDRRDEMRFLTMTTLAKGTYAYGNYVFDKGRVVDFWPSPDGKQVAYLMQDGVTFEGVCSVSDYCPVYRLMVMGIETGDTVMIDKVFSHNGVEYGLPIPEHFDWMYDSKRFAFQVIDEYFIGSIGTSSVQDYDFFNSLPGPTLPVGTGPYFSPTEDLMVYIPGGVFDGKQIVLSKIDGSNQKVLVSPNERVQLSDYDVRWSNDGTKVYIHPRKTVKYVDPDPSLQSYTFASGGELVRGQ